MIRTTPAEFMKQAKAVRFPAIVWDIETAPLPDEELFEFFDETKIEKPEWPGEFNPDNVAVGNLVDPAKIAAKISAARTKHIAKQFAYEHDCEHARDEAWEAFKSMAPLSAVHGRVVAIGYGLAHGDDDILVTTHIDDQEESMLQFFCYIEDLIKRYGGLLVGHNTNNFDIPFVVQRCWKHDIPLDYPFTRYKYMADHYADTMVHFGCGKWKGYVKLDDLARMLGVPGKYKGLSGAEFHKALTDGRRDEAVQYLESDISTTFRVARKLRLIT